MYWFYCTSQKACEEGVLTRSWIACRVSYGLIFLTLDRVKHNGATEATRPDKVCWLSVMTHMFLAALGAREESHMLWRISAGIESRRLVAGQLHVRSIDTSLSVRGVIEGNDVSHLRRLKV